MSCGFADEEVIAGEEEEALELELNADVDDGPAISVSFPTWFPSG